MSKIAQLRLLIKKEKEKGDKSDRQMITECKLLEEAEEHKHKIMIEILQAELTELQQKNEQKEKELMEIEKHKASTLEEVSHLENRFAASVGFSFLYDIFLYVPVYLLIDM